MNTFNYFNKKSDLSGVLYKPIDKDGAWKYSIAKEMKAAGLEVDMNNI